MSGSNTAGPAQATPTEVKVTYNGQTIPVDVTQPALTLSYLRSLAAQAFNELEGKEFTLTYVDKENDNITINESGIGRWLNQMQARTPSLVVQKSIYPTFSGGWRRDLTRECVEPNPGPSAQDALEIFAKKADIPSTDARIAKLLSYIKTKAKYPSTDDLGHITREVLAQVFTDANASDLNNLELFIREAIKHFQEQPLLQSLSQSVQKQWQVEGVTPATTFCCKRQHAIDKLSAIIDDVTWPHGGQILIQGPAATGKTAFVSLFREFSQFNVVSVKMRGVHLSTYEGLINFMSSKLTFNYSRLVKNPDPSKQFWEVLDDRSIWKHPQAPLVLIIDEAQQIIGQEHALPFFSEIKHRQDTTSTPVSAITAVVYCSLVGVEEAERAAAATATTENVFARISVGTWTTKLSFVDMLIWTFADAKEFFNDFNKNNGISITMHADVIKEIYNRFAGHAGYIVTITQNIQAYCKAEQIEDFNYANWTEYLQAHYVTVIKSVRTSSTLRDILHTPHLSGAAGLCKQLLLKSPLWIRPDNHDIYLLTKLGIVTAVSENTYTFSSSIFPGMLLRYLVMDKIAPAADLLFKDPLSFLTFCLPLIRQRAIQNCISFTNQAGVVVRKEDVWVSQLFAAASSVLPANCFIDPQYSTTRLPPSEPKPKKMKTEAVEMEESGEKEKKRGDHGEVDIIVHNGVRYYLEFLITESSKKNQTGITKTVETDILEHLGRFSATGKYQSIMHEPSAVVNVTEHDPPPDIAIPDGCTTAQLYHFVVDEQFLSPKLIWKDGTGQRHTIQFKPGVPVFYNPVTQKITELPLNTIPALATVSSSEGNVYQM